MRPKLAIESKWKEFLILSSGVRSSRNFKWRTKQLKTKSKRRNQLVVDKDKQHADDQKIEQASAGRRKSEEESEKAIKQIFKAQKVQETMRTQLQC